MKRYGSPIAALSMLLLFGAGVASAQGRGNAPVQGDTTGRGQGRGRPEPARPAPRLDGLSIPYPGALDPPHVLDNVKALLNQTNYGRRIPELRDPAVRLRVGRILEVEYDFIPGGYLVVELFDGGRRHLANFAMQPDGTPLVLEGVSDDAEKSKSLDLSDASSRVQRARGKGPKKIHYRYFHNIAEHGVSYCRPLVVATLDEGEVFLNSQGEAFVEEGTPLSREMGALIRRSPVPQRIRLVRVGAW